MKVKITGRQEIRYSQVIEMPDEDYARYKELKRLGQPARFTKKESHDEAYQNIENTLADLISSQMFKRFFVYKRNLSGFEENIFNAEQKEQILQSFKDGRTRIVEDKEKELPFTDNNNLKISTK